MIFSENRYTLFRIMRQLAQPVMLLPPHDFAVRDDARRALPPTRASTSFLDAVTRGKMLLVMITYGSPKFVIVL